MERLADHQNGELYTMAISKQDQNEPPRYEQLYTANCKSTEKSNHDNNNGYPMYEDLDRRGEDIGPRYDALDLGRESGRKKGRNIRTILFFLILIVVIISLSVLGVLLALENSKSPQQEKQIGNVPDTTPNQWLSESSLQTKPQPSRTTTESLQNGAHIVISCEHSKKFPHIKCPYPKTINIIDANYGRTQKNLCPGKVLTVNCIQKRSKSITEGRCNGRGSCRLEATNKIYGDPCPRTEKYLEVKFSCQ